MRNQVLFFILNLKKMPSKIFEEIVSRDKVLQQIVSQYGYTVISMRPEGYETLVLLILEQQVSIDSAKAIF